MSKNVFLFDVIVLGIDVPEQEFPDLSQLNVTVTFNYLSVPITASRINVTEFKSSRSLEFTEDAETLKSNLLTCGLPVVIRYEGFRIGAGQMIWPAEIIDMISPKMSDLTHVGSVELTRGNKRIGSLGLLCRLVVKCINEGAGAGDEVHRNLDEVINPRDIFFVVGEARKCPEACETCIDTLEDERGDEKLFLDFSRYRGMENQRMKPEDIKPPVHTACSDLKQMAREYIEMIDSITRRIHKPVPNPVKEMPLLPSGRDDPHDPDDFRDSYLRFASDHDRPSHSEKIEYAEIPKKEPKTMLPPMDIKPIRFCPVCLTNMSWLPKFAACPKCGVKPMPVLEERQKEKKMTADQILMQYLEKPPNQSDDFCPDPCTREAERRLSNDNDESLTGCRCTCKFGKVCAHCRIRDLCADIFQSEKYHTECQQVQVQAKSSEDFSVINSSSSDCRPYLARVFSELRDLYDMREANKTKSEYDERCEQPTTERMGKYPTENSDAQVKFKKRDEKESQPAKVSPKIHTHTYPSVKNGHQFCLNPKQASVPRRMGWLWNVSSEAIKNGWRPGSVRKPIKNMMRFFLNPPVNPYEKCREIEQERKEVERQKPILNVSKKHGDIFVTLRANTKRRHGSLQNPVVFKIVKSPLAYELRELKCELKNEGFAKCTCHNPVHLCVCRDSKEKHLLFNELSKKCRRRGIANVADKLVLTDTSESEMEFEVDVTPPACLHREFGVPKPCLASHGTQKSKSDMKVKAKYPTKLDPYYRPYDCALREGVRKKAGCGWNGLPTSPAARARQLVALARLGARGRPRTGGRGR